MSVRLTVEAEFDLADIFEAGEAAFGRRQAEMYLSSLQRTFNRIGTQPRMAAGRTIGNGMTRVHPHAAHVILYDVDDIGVLILRIRHAREDWLND